MGDNTSSIPNEPVDSLVINNENDGDVLVDTKKEDDGNENQFLEMVKNYESSKISEPEVKEQVVVPENTDKQSDVEDTPVKPKKNKKPTKKKKKGQTKKKRKSKKEVAEEEELLKKRLKKDNNDLELYEKSLARRLKPSLEDDIFRRHYIAEPVDYPPFEPPEWRRPEMYDPWELRRRMYNSRL